ncbi:MAG: hypothetical protein AAGN82_06825 [Myxococcota bacterium]
MSELRGLGLAIGAFGAAVVGACVLETGGLSPAGVGGAGGSSLTLIGPTSSSLSSGGNPNVGGGGAGPTSSTTVGGGGTGPGGGGAGGMPDVGRIVAGNFHTCFIDPNDQVFCWGRGAQGQLGQGDGDNQTSPVSVNGITAARGASLGTTSTCVVESPSSARCFGGNEDGHFGVGNATEVNLPIASFHNLMNLQSVSVGDRHACVVAGMDAWCTGRGDGGRLGDGLSISDDEPVMVSGGLSVAEVSAGFNHTCARTPAGSVVCWGDNAEGQVGTGTPGGTFPAPAPPVALAGTVEKVVAGNLYTCSLLEVSRELACWGFNGNGQLGSGSLGPSPATPSSIAGLTGVVDFDLGRRHGCAVVEGGMVFCWGDGEFGRLGNGSLNQGVFAPTMVQPITNARQVATGEEHSCALLNDGMVMCWGNNADGQLGNPGTTMATASPVPVQF